jgi:hypothetical protein
MKYPIDPFKFGKGPDWRSSRPTSLQDVRNALIQALAVVEAYNQWPEVQNIVPEMNALAVNIESGISWAESHDRSGIREANGDGVRPFDEDAEGVDFRDLDQDQGA